MLSTVKLQNQFTEKIYLQYSFKKSAFLVILNY